MRGGVEGQRAAGRNRAGSSSVARLGWLSAVRARGALSAVPVQASEKPPPEAQGADGRNWTKGVAVALAGSAAVPAEAGAVATCV